MNKFLKNLPAPAWISLVLSVPCLSTGCGGGTSDGPDLFPVTGTVQFDGTPVEEGRILFRTDSGAGRAYSTEIKNGSYTLEIEPGPVKVEVTASRVIPGKFGEPASPDEEPPPLSEMYIPAKYNSESTLTANVSAGDNTIPFDLTAK